MINQPPCGPCTVQMMNWNPAKTKTRYYYRSQTYFRLNWRFLDRLADTCTRYGGLLLFDKRTRSTSNITGRDYLPAIILVIPGYYPANSPTSFLYPSQIAARDSRLETTNCPPKLVCNRVLWIRDGIKSTTCLKYALVTKQSAPQSCQKKLENDI